MPCLECKRSEWNYPRKKFIATAKTFSPPCHWVSTIGPFLNPPLHHPYAPSGVLVIHPIFNRPCLLSLVDYMTIHPCTTSPGPSPNINLSSGSSLTASPPPITRLSPNFSLRSQRRHFQRHSLPYPYRHLDPV